MVDHVYKFKNGRGLKISITCVDSGGHFTQEVYEACRARVGKRDVYKRQEQHRERIRNPHP